MRVIHDDERVLATDARVAASLVAQTRGLMFRRSFPGDGLVFPFDDTARRNAHMLFVRFPIDAVWVADDRVTAVERLRPWRGFGSARADTLVELPAGTADSVATGDVVRVVSES